MSGATPHSRDMTAPYSPAKTPSRRVLGHLNLNTPPAQTMRVQSSELGRAQGPLKHTTHYMPAGLVNKENFTAPDAASRGKKRGIDEVEAVELAENLKMLARGRDADTLDSRTRLTTDAMQRHTANNPISLAHPGSPTERATPSPEPELIQDSQRSNQSFSDFLNYDQCASQKSEHAAPAEPAPTSIPVLAPAPVIVEEKKRSRAELLRTRLNFGLYKVKTNQVNKRDVDIITNYEARASYSSDARNASRSTAMTSSAESLATPRVPNITISSPRHEQRPNFVQANLDPFRPIGKLGAAPVLFAPPQAASPVPSHAMNKYNLTSSPPDVALPQSVSPNQLMSPAQTPLNQSASRIRMGEHDDADITGGTVTAHQRLQRLKEQQYRESELSSNVVKGNAAAGLLELMNRQR
ncbi:hypothetical protein ACN47E_008775 [Coniothyrium glycines]